MSHNQSNVSRRDFLKWSGFGVVGGTVAMHLPRVVMARQPLLANQSRAALTSGDSRADNIYRSLKLIEEDIKKGLAMKKKVVIKPNIVEINQQLTATHAECLEGILEFLKPLVKEEIMIAESPAGVTAATGYEEFGYYRLAQKYNVNFIELDEQPTEIMHVLDEHYMPQPVRFSKLLMDPDVYVISSAMLKTHDRAIVTLSLKNIVLGAAIKDPGYNRRTAAEEGKRNDKPTVHGGRNNEGIHFNLFTIGKRLHPHLAVLDGFQGMEGNGPSMGTPVDHRVAVASTDWLAADRIGVELMGFDFQKIGYLKFASEAHIGQGDLSQIEILGERVENHIRQYKPHDSID
ncbi:DUF362 domain-containing protein, partial [bacterium]|nr:DUF362 domain-containing protein [bacterium]